MLSPSPLRRHKRGHQLRRSCAAGPTPELDISTPRPQRIREHSLQTLFVTGKFAMSHRPTISLWLCALLLSAVLLPAGQAAGGSPPKTASAAKGAASAQKPKEKTDVCPLLTRAEIQVVQSEPVEKTEPSAQPSGGVVMLQCLYRTTTFPKTVSLPPAPPPP